MSYTWNVPTKVLFGPGTVRELHREPMPGKKALLLLSNGRSAKANGSLAAVTEELNMAGVEMVLFDRIPANPTEPVLMEGVEFARANGCDFIIGLGGGSVLDAATIISAVAPQKKGRVWDYVRGGTGGAWTLEEKPLPYISITTSAGTGSEVDCKGVVTNPETREKIAVAGAYPIFSIVDPELMLTVPPLFTAYQGFDALFHCVEGYISKFANEASEMVDLTAISHIARNLPQAVANGQDLEARTKVAFGSTLGGYSMEVGTCVSQHALEHALSGYHGELPHGAGLIMISEAYFSKWISAHVCDDRFVQMAHAMGRAKGDNPMDFITALRDLRAACGVSNLKMSDYGITPDEFPGMAKNAMDSMGRLFACDRFEMTTEDIIQIYQMSFR